jgi:hypothetical protein
MPRPLRIEYEDARGRGDYHTWDGVGLPGLCQGNQDCFWVMTEEG